MPKISQNLTKHCHSEGVKRPKKLYYFFEILRYAQNGKVMKNEIFRLRVGMTK